MKILKKNRVLCWPGAQTEIPGVHQLARAVTHFVVGVLGVFLCSSSLFAHEDPLTFTGIELAYNMQFERATQIFDQIIQSDPENPRGYVLQSVNYYYRMHLENNPAEFEDRFKKYAADAIRISQRDLADAQKRLDATFYLGTVHMYLAAYHASKSNWLQAFRYAKIGLERLKKIVAIDPNYYDAYLGLGLYHYYADVLPKFVKAVSFLLGVEADRKKGIEELQIAAQKGRYSKFEAMLLLGNIYLYMEKEYDKSLPYFEELAQRFPDNRGFWVLLGENQQKLGNHKLSVDYFNRVIESTSSGQFPELVAFASYQLGEVYSELNDFEKAIGYYLQTIKSGLRTTEGARRFSAWSYLKIGVCYEILGRRTAAIPFYRQVRESDNQNAYDIAQIRLENRYLPTEIDLIRGRNYVATGRYNEALRIYEKALKETKRQANGYPQQKLPEIYYHIGKALFEQKNYQGAISKFSEILRMDNVDQKWIKPWTHFRLGNCYKELGNIYKMRTEFGFAYALDDEDLHFEIDKIREKLNDN